MKKLKQAQGNKAAQNWNKDMFQTMATMFPEDLKTKDIRAVPNAVVSFHVAGTAFRSKIELLSRKKKF